MRNLIWLVLVALLVMMTVSSSLSDTTEDHPLISVDFENEDLRVILEDIAGQMGVGTYLGPAVKGSARIHAINQPWESVLKGLLRDSKCVFQLIQYSGKPVLIVQVSHCGLVADAECLDEERLSRFGEPPANSVTSEFILEEAPSEKVVVFLRDLYRNVRFTSHPTKNGFFVTGSPEDLRRVETEVEILDRPREPLPVVEDFVSVQHGDLSQIVGILRTILPDVEYRVDRAQRILHLNGTSDAIELAKELTKELDRVPAGHTSF